AVSGRWTKRRVELRRRTTASSVASALAGAGRGTAPEAGGGAPAATHALRNSPDQFPRPGVGAGGEPDPPGPRRGAGGGGGGGGGGDGGGRRGHAPAAGRRRPGPAKTEKGEHRFVDAVSADQPVHGLIEEGREKSRWQVGSPRRREDVRHHHAAVPVQVAV